MILQNHATYYLNQTRIQGSELLVCFSSPDFTMPHSLDCDTNIYNVEIFLTEMVY